MAKKNSNSHKVGVAAGLAVLAAAAAGAYFLYGKGGAARRQKAKSWMLKMKGDVLERLENMKRVDKAAYNRAVDEVGRRYKALKAVAPGELSVIVREMKGHWKNIERELAKAGKSKRK